MPRDERWIQEFFSEVYGLELRKLSELPASTADFEHLSASGRDFVAELKTLIWEPPSAERGWTLNPDGSAERDDNAPERVASKIHEAFKQLRGYSEPKILVLLNCDPALDVLDLLEAYRGYLVYGDASFGYVNRMSRQLAEGRIRFEKSSIDLYIWLDFFKPTPRFLFPSSDGKRLLHQYFAESQPSAWAEAPL
jgi:hypothetical protein